MKHTMTLFLLLLILFCNILPAQTFEPPTLSSPLRLPAEPSGTFAEIRTNHYHGGIDLRIGGDQGIGTPVYAPADGYVSRLRISSYDGGKMLYINHKGNVTTVYLHLDGYHGDIAKYVLNHQRTHQCYAFDTTLPEGILPVRQGQVIAYAGNSGMSGGPHLHFEVRNSLTQRSLNPLAYGLSIDDTISPTIKGIRLLPFNKDTRLNHANAPLQIGANGLGTKENPIPVFGRFYIGTYATDRSKGSTMNNGFDRIDIWVDGVPFFQYHMDEINFDDTRSINAQLDWDHYTATRQPYILTRRLCGDPTKPARTYGDGSIGFIDSDTTLHRVTIAVTDFNGNRSTRSIYLRNHFETIVPMHEIPERPPLRLLSDSLHYNQPIQVYRGDYQIEMPAGMTYYDDLLTHGIQNDRRYISPIYTVQPWKSPYPPHRTWTLRVPVVVGYEPEQLVLCRIDKGKTAALSTRLVERHIVGKPGRWLEAKVRHFGNFVVMADTTAPSIKPMNFKDGQRVGRFLKMKLRDDLSGIQEYRCLINGEWVLAEFDGKSSTLSIDLTLVPKSAATLDLRILVTDACKNSRELRYRLRR